LTLLSRRLRVTTQHIESLAFLDVPARLAQVLLQLIEQDSEPSAEGTMLSNAISQKTLAAMIGSTREWVNAILHDWQTRQIITYQGRRLVVRSVQNLQELVEQEQAELGV